MLLRGQSPAPPSLGAADSFAVLGGSSVTSTGSTVVTGNLGVSPGNSISGSITMKVGATYRNDSLARQAQRDATSAYNDLAGRTCTANLSADLGGMTLGPGVYCFTSTAQLTGTLILDPANDPNAVWIFRIGGTLTTAPGSSVVLLNGGYEGNIFWQVDDSVTLGAGTAFLGNVLAHKDITLHSGANVSGRLLAQGVVSLADNNVSLCCDLITLSPATLPNGTICTVYSTTTFVASGGTGQYTFSVSSGTLPDGLVLIGGTLSGTPTKKGTFPVTVTATDSHGCSGNRLYVIDIGCPPDGPPIPLPLAKACEAYCQKITPNCGVGPHTFSALPGTLPAGLILSSDGMLCGTPTTPGDYTFTITDETSGCPRRYSLQVVCNITISPETLQAGTACVFACQTLTASCGTPPYTFSVSSGTPPAGVTISPDGMLCETPTTPVGSTFTVTATDAKGCTGSRTYTVPAACNVTISPATLPNGTVGALYDQTITGSCGTGPYTCSLTDALLPAGLTHTNCRISGTPTTAACYTFPVTVKDANGCSSIISYTICVDPCPITTSPPLPTLPDASVCVPYTHTITASCATAPYTCSLTDGTLPSGLGLANCTISGTPTTAGLSMFTITVTDAASNSGFGKYTLLVTQGVVLSPAALPSGTPGAPYNEVITANGGTGPYTFLLSGSLPPGLSFTPTPPTATISGTPTTVGCFPFTVTVTDANGCSTSVTYTICVVAGGPALSGWGMVVLSILLVGAGFVMVSKGDLHA